jgi:FkbM family methyltransferase
MSFISYAQNYEDVMLWRALKHVKNGFYIDVGANDPVVDSVTKAFYDRGWRGINIEPIKSHHQNLLETRPNDINLHCAAGFEHGQVDIWECDVRGWATASSDSIQQHEQAGHTGVLHKVSVFPLGDICEQYAQRDIHFLKIDFEGFEKNVLRGMNFIKFRPWIVVIEATKPNSTDEIHDDWEGLIVSNDYVFAYADGINRFYVSKEQAPNLLNALLYPPSIFDNFIQFQQLKAELRAQGAEAKVHEAQEQAMKIEAKSKAWETQEQVIQAAFKASCLEKIQSSTAEVDFVRQAHINALLNSTSWRITAPLRWPVHQVRLLRTHGFKQRVKAVVKKVLCKVVPWVLSRPKHKSLVAQLAYKLGIAERLKPFVTSIFVSHQQRPHQPSVDLTSLTPRARQIYQDLKLAIKSKQKGGA